MIFDTTIPTGQVQSEGVRFCKFGTQNTVYTAFSVVLPTGDYE